MELGWLIAGLVIGSTVTWLTMETIAAVKADRELRKFHKDEDYWWRGL